MTDGSLLAHGVGRVYESPLPVWLYLVGAAATVVISFVIRAVADRDPTEPEPRVILSSRGTGFVLGMFRIAGLATLGLLVLFAFLDPEPGLTVTPLLFWVLLIMGTLLVSSIVEGVWDRSNPWATIESFYRDEDAAPDAGDPFPWWVGPALLYALFWFELVSGRGFDPIPILVVIAAYTLFALTFRSRRGASWREADPLSILFGFASRTAPLAVDRQGRLTYRGAVAGLDEGRPMSPASFASVFVLLASTTLDNLRETLEWRRALEILGIEHADATLIDSVALLVLALPFLLTFVAAVSVSRRWLSERLSLWETARRFAWSLIPIGIAYVLAHNIPLLIIGIPELLDQILDGFGLDLFSRYVPSPRLVWFLEIVVVVGGHILGVLGAHRVGLRLTRSHQHAVKSHVALTILMSLFTVSTLWLLSLPLVTD